MVRTLADPRWEGRGIGTAGIDSAARWIAARMRAAGLKPAGDSSSWFQSFEVTTGVVPEAPCVLQAGSKRFELGDPLQPLGFSTNGSAHARVVFAGYGITAPGYQWDDYAGIDAHDAIVLVLTQEPGEMDCDQPLRRQLEHAVRRPAHQGHQRARAWRARHAGGEWPQVARRRTRARALARGRGVHDQRAARGVDLRGRRERRAGARRARSHARAGDHRVRRPTALAGACRTASR